MYAPLSPLTPSLIELSQIGGALYADHYGGNVRLVRSTIDRCDALISGGGLFVDAGYASGGACLLIDRQWINSGTHARAHTHGITPTHTHDTTHMTQHTQQYKTSNTHTHTHT